MMTSHFWVQNGPLAQMRIFWEKYDSWFDSYDSYDLYVPLGPFYHAKCYENSQSRWLGQNCPFDQNIFLEIFTLSKFLLSFKWVLISLT